MEDEGLYVGKRTKVSWKRQNKLEQRIMAMGSERYLLFNLKQLNHLRSEKKGVDYVHSARLHPGIDSSMPVQRVVNDEFYFRIFMQEVLLVNLKSYAWTGLPAGSLKSIRSGLAVN